MSNYTFYWLTGEREVFEGDSPGDALNKAGYSQGALRALDFWAHGERNDYQWNKDERVWVRFIDNEILFD